MPLSSPNKQLLILLAFWLALGLPVSGVWALLLIRAEFAGGVNAYSIAADIVVAMWILGGVFALYKHARGRRNSPSR